MDITFLKKQYQFPDDLLVYIDILKLTEDVSENITKEFVLKIKQMKGADKYSDAFVIDILRKRAVVFISKLADHGIYSRTIDDYAADENAKAAIMEVVQDGLNSSAKFLLNTMDNTMREMNEASQRAEASVTGSGVVVFSNSLIQLALTSAMESSVINKQAQQAEQQYQKEITQIQERGSNEYERKDNQYLASTYIPRMKQVLQSIAFSMMGKYLTDLANAGCFDEQALNFTDINRSTKLLENLKFTNNKNAVLENALMACPFNVDVYVKAAEIEKIDEGTFETVRKFGLVRAFRDIVTADFNAFSQTGNLERDLNERSIFFYTIALCGDTEEELIRKFALPTYRKAVKSYQKMKDLMESQDAAKKYLREIDYDATKLSISDIQRRVKDMVAETVSESNCKTLVKRCGYTDLYEKITPKGYEVFRSKKEADEFYERELNKKLASLVNAAKCDYLKEEQKQIEERISDNRFGFADIISDKFTIIYFVYVIGLALCCLSKNMGSEELLWIIFPLIFLPLLLLVPHLISLFLKSVQERNEWKEQLQKVIDAIREYENV